MIIKTLFASVFTIATINADIKSVQETIHTNQILTYDQQLKQIEKDRLNFKSHPVSNDSCKSYLINCFDQKIFPYWIGTKWDYNGYTNRPGNDKIIACGYFVSTTLKHMGFKWNRFDLAKMYSSNIVESICEKTDQYPDKKTALLSIINLPDQLYIVGLSSHVGFLLKEGDKIWFVHSNYYENEGPIKEIAKNSQAFNDSGIFYIGAFFTPKNMERWVNGNDFNFY